MSEPAMSEAVMSKPVTSDPHTPGFATARRNMVDGQVRTNDVTDPRIIEAMLTVPREAFVPERARALAYLDLDLDVSEPAGGNRFLLKPVVVARLLQAAGIDAADSVLVAGCATGYTAALAARLAQRVHATDPDPALVARARAALDGLNLGAVTVTVAPVAEGDAANAPFDVIVLEGAAEIAPQTLYRQLKEGGRLVGVFRSGGVMRATLVTRSRDDFGSRILFDAAAPVLPGLQRVPEFVF